MQQTTAVAPNQGRRSARRSLELIFLTAAVIAIASCVILYAVSNAVLASNVLQESMLRRATSVEEVLSALKDAEIGQRGFLLTGDDAYLKPFNEAARHLPAELANMKTYWAADPKTVTAISETVRERMAELRLTIELQRSNHPDTANQIVRTGERKQLMEQLRSIITGLKTREENNLEQETKRQDRLTELCTTLFLITTASNIVFLGWAYGRLSKADEDVESATLLRYTNS